MLVRGQACNWNWSLPMSKLPPLFLLLLLLLFYTLGSASASKWPCLSLFFRTMPTLSPAISSIHVEEARWGQVDCSLRICARVHVRRDNDSSLLPLRIRCYSWRFEQPLLLAYISRERFSFVSNPKFREFWWTDKWNEYNWRCELWYFIKLKK